MPALKDWLDQSTQKLKSAGINTARLDCLLMLEDELGKERHWLLSRPERKLSQKQLANLNSRLNRRLLHEPMAYIRGTSEFYGRSFFINKHVLDPRPETENIIGLLLSINSKITTASIDKTKATRLVVCDVGTGSGVLAITAALELGTAEIYATDINKKSLAVAKKNATHHKTEIVFKHGNLLEPVSKRLTENSVLICNLPYVPDNYPLNDSAMWEPKTAVYGGTDGLDIYRKLFGQIKQTNLQPGYIITESLPSQHQLLQQTAAEAGYQLSDNIDYVQLFIKPRGRQELQPK